MEGHLGLLAGLLPPELAGPVRQHLLHPQSPLQACRRHVVAYARAAAAAAADVALGLAAENQGLAGGLALLALLAAALVVVHWVGRLVMWWTRVALRLASWAIVAALAAWVWNRGPAASLTDAVVLAGRVLGYLAVLKDVWLEEYNRYEGQQRHEPRGGGHGAHGRSSARY
ncbi:hypothetical protein G6O67_007003 [Ophiocordyceps sinensis]|uniref:Uncharacterized protein n=1 Tax=Ophiocordyceps sinensis TaxID=72228 RepID=A0A8H4LSY7_9HYPO|nr:hypothetical protein G6O67_007003 [Ophiocordyceps sinensis]